MDNTQHIQTLLCQTYQEELQQIESGELSDTQEFIELLANKYFFPENQEIDKIRKREKQSTLKLLEKLIDVNILTIDKDKIIRIDEEKLQKHSMALKRFVDACFTSNDYERILVTYRKKKEAKKLFEVLQHYDIVMIDDKTKSLVVSQCYYNCVRRCRNEKNDVDNLIKNLCPIIESEVQYINQALEVYKGRNNKYLPLTKEVLQEIKYHAFVINNLKENGITSKNYFTKLNAYLNRTNRILEEFGALVLTPFPFSNPNVLYIEIERILLSHHLNAKQKSEFYKELGLKTRAPNTSSVKQQFIEEEMYDDFNNLTEEEQNSIIDYEHEDFTPSVKVLIQKYGYKVPIKKEDAKITKWKTYTDEKLPQTFHDMKFTLTLSIFLKYISDIFTSAPSIAQLEYEALKEKYRLISTNLSFLNYDALLNNLPKLLHSSQLFK